MTGSRLAHLNLEPSFRCDGVGPAAVLQRRKRQERRLLRSIRTSPQPSVQPITFAFCSPHEAVRRFAATDRLWTASQVYALLTDKGSNYYELATLGEERLLEQDYAKARQYYQAAILTAPGETGRRAPLASRHARS
jgi:hypothetical protein